MKKLLLILALLLLLPTGAISQTTNQLGFIQNAAWSCPLALTAVATLSCQAAPSTGVRNYITDVMIAATSANAGTVQLISGTTAKTPCDTAAVVLTPVFNLTAMTGAVPQVAFPRTMPIVPTAGHAICAVSTGSNATYAVMLSGYKAP